MVNQSSMESVHCGQHSSLLKMDASLMFQNILDYNATKRVEVLIVMRKLLKTGNGNSPFHNISRNDILNVLYHVLDDSRWEVRYQCLLLICAIIPSGVEEIESSIMLVIPKVVANLGHENVNVRRAALQVLHIYMKFTSNLQNFQNIFIVHGLENSEYIVRKGCIMSIGILFTSDFESENLFPLVECLSKHFVDGDASLFYPIFLAMQKLNELLGNSIFDLYLQKLDEEAASTYKRVLNKFTLNSRMSSSSGSHSSFCNVNGLVHTSSHKLLKYDFGIFQPYIIEKLKSDDWKTRSEALEHMKIIIRDIQDFCEKISDMDEFLIFLSSLLEDSNFKIVTQALSVYDLLIDKFKNQIRRFLKTFVTSVSKKLGDPKPVVREHAIKVVHKLMHHIHPTEVLGNLLQYKDSRNLRLREEILNRVTAAVLTFPSYNFEFHPLCETVAPLIADTKRRVRLAALECFAALAQAMGPTRLVLLVTAVDAVEINCDADGLLSAVQARLARRILPRCTEDGVVTYAIILPSSAGGQNRNTSSWGADIEWIMAASGSSSSTTPPSRSKEVFSSNYHLNDETNVLQFINANKTTTDDIKHTFKKDNNWLSETAIEMHNESKIELVSGDENSNQHLPKIRHSSNDDKVKQVIVPGPEKSSLLVHALPEEKKFSSDNSKTKPVIMNSKIPVLARISGKRNAFEEQAAFVKPIRAVSAQRHNTLPTFQVRYSANHRRSSNHAFQDARVQNFVVDRSNRETIMRKISPTSSPHGRQPILVRSPSLNSIGQLPNEVNTSNQVLYEAYTSPNKSMGNFGSYLRPSPGGVIVAQPTPVHLDDVNVYGVTVLDESGKLSATSVADGWEMIHSSSHNSSQDENWKQSIEGLPEVYEMHVDSPTNYSRKMTSSPLNIVDNGNISIAKITREKMLKRQQEIMKEAEERRISKERDQYLTQHVQEHIKQVNDPESQASVESPSHDIVTESELPTEPAVTEREFLNEIPEPAKPQTPAKQIPVRMSQSIQQNKRIESAQRKGSSKPLSRSSSLKTPNTLRKFSQNQNGKNSQTSKYNLAASSLALFDESSDEVATYPNPNEALKKALKSLSTDTWMGKIEGIRTIQRLSKNHPDVIQAQLHPVVLALLTEVKNLRSSVARAAILAIGDLFVSLKKNVEQDLDLITSTLLSKCGETVGFIREDIEKVMDHLIDTITPSKAALAIIAGGASHRNGAVRKVAAQSLLAVVEKMGASRILTQSKEVTEKLLPTTAQFLMDGMPLTRWYGRRIFHLLMQHPSFDKLLLRYVQPSTLRNINNILDSVRKKGAGDLPKEGVSAKTLKSETYRNGLLSRTM